jgi:hypothetical protein
MTNNKVHCCYCHKDVDSSEIVATDQHGNWCFECNEWEF